MNRIFDLIEELIDDPKTRWQIVRHLLVGGSGVIVNYVLFIILRQYYEFSTLISSIIVHIVLVCYIFPLQKYFTFSNPLNTSSQIFRFLANDVLYSSGDFLLAYLFIDLIGLSPFFGKAFALALLTPMSFIIQRFWVFSHKG